MSEQITILPIGALLVVVGMVGGPLCIAMGFHRVAPWVLSLAILGVVLWIAALLLDHFAEKRYWADVTRQAKLSEDKTP